MNSSSSRRGHQTWNARGGIGCLEVGNSCNSENGVMFPNKRLTAASRIAWNSLSRGEKVTSTLLIRWRLLRVRGGLPFPNRSQTSQTALSQIDGLILNEPGKAL